MKNIKSIYIILLIGLIAGSCEKIIDITVPDKSRKIVLNSIINPDDALYVQLSQSKSILEDNIELVLKDADVKVFEDDELVGVMENLSSDAYVLPDYYPSIGKTYRLEVDHPVLNPVQAEITVPEPVYIIEMDTSTSVGEWGQRTHNINLTIEDPPSEKNYYAVSINLTTHVYDWVNEVFTDSTETYSTYIQTLSDTDTGIGDDLIDNELSFFIDGKLFFSDEIFSGQSNKKELALEYYIFAPGDSVSVDVRLDHIDQSYFYYSVSKEKYYRADGNPFAEPVQVYNNIKNGFGILTSYSRTHRRFNVFVEGDK